MGQPLWASYLEGIAAATAVMVPLVRYVVRPFTRWLATMERATPMLEEIGAEARTKGTILERFDAQDRRLDTAERELRTVSRRTARLIRQMSVLQKTLDDDRGGKR